MVLRATRGLIRMLRSALGLHPAVAELEASEQEPQS